LTNVPVLLKMLPEFGHGSPPGCTKGILFPGTESSTEHGEHLSSLPLRNKIRVFFYVLAAAVALPVAYYVFTLSRHTLSFLAFYRPEQLFHETDDPSIPPAWKKNRILESLNAEIEQDTQTKKGEEIRLLGRLDRLWRSVRSYVSPSGSDEPQVLERYIPPGTSQKRASQPASAHPQPLDSKGATEAAQAVLREVLSLTADPEVIQSASGDLGRGPAGAGRPNYEPLLPASPEPLRQVKAAGAPETAEWLYRFESLRGVRTQGMIYQFSKNLALEGTVDSTPVGETDPDLSDFGFRAVHALNFLQDLPTPAIMLGREGTHSGYPVSYGIGLNYQVSPLMNLRFDYSHETPNDYFLEYRGSWESSLVTDYSKSLAEDSLSVHSFFLGLRYLYKCKQKTTWVPLHTGFFYSTSTNNEPLVSNVSLGFSVGGGINRKDLRVGFAYRFRIWDNPEDQFLKEKGMEELQTRVSNQFLFTIVF
jgi:hypothetical protein